MSRRIALALCVILSGCAYHAPKIASPTGWQAEGMAATADPATLPDETWWTRFNNAELNGLVTEAKTNNHDLKIAVTRILQSEASYNSSQAALVPNLNASLGTSQSGRENLAGDFTNSGSWDTRLSSSYQLDLFGNVRSGVSASKLRLDSTRFNRETVEITLVSNVINSYLQVLSARERLTFAQNRLNNAEEIFRLLETQRRVGTLSDFELAQQRSSLASQRAAIPGLRSTERQALNALAVLLGRMPEGFDVKGQSLSEVSLPEVSAGIPSTLLLRRPDLRGAEANLHAGHFDVNAARAARLPVISLTASGSSGGREFADLLSPGSILYSLGASVGQTIFSGGRLTAQQRSSEAAYQGLMETYRKAILTAFQDVENALTIVENTAVQAGFTLEASEQADEAYRLAQLRYRAGTVDFQAVLNAQNQALNAQESLVNNRLTRYQAVVTLVQALGGGWDGELRPLQLDRASMQEAAAKARSDDPT